MTAPARRWSDRTVGCPRTFSASLRRWRPSSPTQAAPPVPHVLVGHSVRQLVASGPTRRFNRSKKPTWRPGVVDSSWGPAHPGLADRQPSARIPYCSWRRHSVVQGRRCARTTWERPRQSRPAGRRTTAVARTGGTRLVKTCGCTTAAATLERLVGEVRKLPPEVHPMVMSHWCQPKCFTAMADYIGAFLRDKSLMAAMTPPPHIPVVVISGGNQPPETLASQRQLAECSAGGRHIVARGSAHWVAVRRAGPDRRDRS